MIYLKHYFFKYITIVSCLFMAGCHTETNIVDNDMGEKVYFASFSGYSIPLKLVDKITKEEATSRDSYYVAIYDDSGVLLGVEKYFQGHLFFRHDYIYSDNGVLKESRIVNADGNEVINHFDEKGEVIKGD